nr:MAG TPA: Protein of unknown function (DUF551) [Caudoviricetes sp.]
MMAECIEREAAIKAIYESDPNGIRRALGFNVGQIEEALRAVPAVSVPQWISVKDRLPEPDENPVLAGCEPFNMVFMAWYCSQRKRWELPSKIDCEVTHWMPTSSLPRMDGAE